MKAISLWQPWATLIVTGHKQIETRGWQTPYRGPLVIHAAKRSQDIAYWFFVPEFRQALAEAGYMLPEDLPLGAALGVVDLERIVRTEAIRTSLSKSERAFGNYEDGRFAWHQVNPRQFANPIPLRGAQGLFDCTVPLP